MKVIGTELPIREMLTQSGSQHSAQFLSHLDLRRAKRVINQDVHLNQVYVVFSPSQLDLQRTYSIRIHLYTQISLMLHCTVRITHRFNLYARDRLFARGDLQAPI